MSTQEDLEHLNRFPYNNIRVQADRLLPFLQHPPPLVRVWLIEERDEVVGFINYGNVIPGHMQAFGLVIGLRYTRRGYGQAALEEMIQNRAELGIEAINGYCHQENMGIIRVMQALGFTQDLTFNDMCDANSIKFSL